MCSFKITKIEQNNFVGLKLFDLTIMTKNKQLNLPLLRLLDGVGQVDGFHGDFDFAHAAEEICDEGTSWVPQEKVRTVARCGHTLTLGTYFELGKQNKTQAVCEIRYVTLVRQTDNVGGFNPITATHSTK